MFLPAWARLTTVAGERTGQRHGDCRLPAPALLVADANDLRAHAALRNPGNFPIRFLVATLLVVIILLGLAMQTFALEIDQPRPLLHGGLGPGGGSAGLTILTIFSTLGIAGQFFDPGSRKGHEL
jgi:hypothetical protein